MRRRSNMISEQGSANLSVTIEREVRDKIYEEAERLGMNRSAYVRKLIEIGRREMLNGKGR